VHEAEPLERLAADGELMMYGHDGFWQCADTIRDVDLLRRLWDSGEAPWKTWIEEPVAVVKTA
jgi:glucose-1-phosphate cytidylyltransferase